MVHADILKTDIFHNGVFSSSAPRLDPQSAVGVQE